MKETKDIILLAAYKMFLDNNYEAVTINSIIKAAGITKGGIYHYYASKEELFKAVVDKFLISSRVSTPIKYTSLKEFIEGTINLAKEQTCRKADSFAINHSLPAQHISLFMDAFKYYPNFAEIGKKFYSDEIDKWRVAIDFAKSNGEIPSDVDSEIMAMNFIVIGTNIVTNALFGGSLEYAIEMYGKQLKELYKSLKT